MRFLCAKLSEGIRHIPDALNQMGHMVDVFEDYCFGKKGEVEESVILKLKKQIASGNYDYVISFDYFAPVAEASHESGVPYISWSYDSPVMNLYKICKTNDSEFIFVFDRAQAEHLYKETGLKCHYMPLAGSPYVAKGLTISYADEKLFSWDVAFVGSLYDDNSYNNLIYKLPTDMQQELQTYLTENNCHWEKTRFWPCVSEKLSDMLIKVAPDLAEQAGQMPMEEYLGINLLTRKLAQMERLTLLNRLSETYPVTVFTNSTNSFLSSIKGHVFPAIDYRTDMYKVFHLSRINLNITLPSIETGIPMRVFDIMSVGGFCLTNYQEEIEELFTIGEEIEVFRSLDELKEKVGYYLSHESKRLQIAMNGYRKICEKHNYCERLQEMLKIVQENDA